MVPTLSPYAALAQVRPQESIVSPMAYQARKTEHAGSKKGCGAFWGPRQDAKAQSNRRRRRNDTKESTQGFEDHVVVPNNSVDPTRWRDACGSR